MTELWSDVFAGALNPGDIMIVRSIVTTGAQPSNVDTAVYSDVMENYTITRNANGSVTVAHTGGTLADGIDTLWNIEKLQFSNAPSIDVPIGTVTIDDTTPTEDQPLIATGQHFDPLFLVLGGSITYTWEAETAPGVWTEVGTGGDFTPDDSVVGKRLRVVARFFDLDDILLEAPLGSATSDPTDPVTAVNDLATGRPTISGLTPPEVSVQVSADTSTIIDPDGFGPFSYQWLANDDPIAGATAQTFTPAFAQLGQTLRVRVSYTDLQGFNESMVSEPTAQVVAGIGAFVSVQNELSFGRKRINTNTTKTVRVTNTGTRPLIVSSVAITGAAAFTAVIGTCSAPVDVGRSCNLSVTFRPTSVGALSGTLTVTSNATNNPRNVSLTGTGR